MSVVTYGLEGNVAVITVDNPPMNAMTMAMRAGLLEAVNRAAADLQAQAAVVIGANGTFIPGADIKEFGKPITGPSGRDVIAAIERAGKPVVAALAGNALGGGLEVALGCHARIATADVKIGLPEVNLGLIPGAGGTQRLTRIAGPAVALDLITAGKLIDGRKALELGIVDELVPADAKCELHERALVFARRLAADSRPLRVTSTEDAKIANADPALFDDARKKNERKWRGQLAPWKIVDCIEAACSKPFDLAYAEELAAYEACKASPQRAALTYLFKAEREAARIPGMPAETRPAPIASVAVIGAGTMGTGIAMSFANAGIPVVQLETAPELLARGRAMMEKNYATSVARGSMSEAKAARARALIRGTLSYGDLADCDFVIEAVFEDIAIKQEVFRALDQATKPGAILATNTSTLDIDAIAAVTSRPENVIGAHFFSPANVMKLLEVVRAGKTSWQTIATTMGVAKTIGKVAVLAGNCDGFIGNRILAVYGRECDFLLEEGATPWQIDRALQGFGFPMGLYLMRDMAGLDVGWRIRKYREQFRDKALRYSPIADRLCELGRFGQKTGKGYYAYDGRNGTPDPAVEALTEQVAAELKIARRAVSDDEIVTRVLTAMVNEGLKILGEGIALRAGDIDVCYVHGYGFPRHQGGPMYWAEQRGWDAVYETVQAYHASQGAFWKPAPKLLELAGRTAEFA
ncbi:MAG TPA: 3-hydroxyacyl-CoA dehydrogenase NAD-binding domain-containing protein [Burkholderiaceae bacterium]|nr:3-hydroxyacyl-CoA dehydrogenase NAD-binding domain-containing protein [Burkholderiaceae bacterium]